MGLLDTSLEVVKLAAKVANPELVQAATKANIEALELSKKNLELQKEMGELARRVEELEGKLTLTGKVFREAGFVYLEGDPDGFCSRCWEVDHKLVHIIQMHVGKEGVKPACPECKTATWHHPPPNPRLAKKA
jgi:hypothetical protein